MSKPGWIPGQGATLPGDSRGRSGCLRNAKRVESLRSTFGVSHRPVPQSAWNAAGKAYRAAPFQDLRKATERFLAEPQYQQRYFAGLGVQSVELVRDGVKALLLDVDIAPEGS